MGLSPRNLSPGWFNTTSSRRNIRPYLWFNIAFQHKLPSNTGRKSSGEIQVLFDFLRMLKKREVSSNRFSWTCIYPLNTREMKRVNTPIYPLMACVQTWHTLQMLQKAPIDLHFQWPPVYERRPCSCSVAVCKLLELVWTVILLNTGDYCKCVSRRLLFQVSVCHDVLRMLFVGGITG